MNSNEADKKKIEQELAKFKAQTEKDRLNSKNQPQGFPTVSVLNTSK